MEKFLADENKALFDQIKGDLSQFRPSIESVREAYEVLEIGEFNNEVWTELRDAGPAQIIAKYRHALDEELASTGVKHSVLKRVALNGTEEAVENLLSALHAAQRFAPRKSVNRDIYLDLSYVSIIDGKIAISDDDAELIKDEYCRVYIEDEEQFKMYSILIKARELYKNLAAMNQQYKYQWRTGFGFGVLDTFIGKRDSAEPTISGQAVANTAKFGALHRKQ